MADLNSSDLLGSWVLAEWRIDYPDGRASAWPFGQDAIGLLLYAPDGWMSATMSRRERVSLSAGSAVKADDASKARAFQEYLAYSGRWSLQGSTVAHDVVMSLNPSLIGTPHARDARIENGTLALVARESLSSGSERVHHILWRRPV